MADGLLALKFAISGASGLASSGSILAMAMAAVGTVPGFALAVSATFRVMNASSNAKYLALGIASANARNPPLHCSTIFVFEAGGMALQEGFRQTMSNGGVPQ